MLGVYSRYCRFFVEDNEMKMKYENEIIVLKETNEENNEVTVKYLIDFLKMINLHQNYKPSDFIQLIMANKENMNAELKLKSKWQKLEEDRLRSGQSIDSINYSNVWFVMEEFENPFDISVFQESQNDFCKPKNSPNKNMLEYFIWKKSSIRNQNFSFCTDIIRHISNNYECRQKLYQTCKYFYAKFQIPICHRLAFDRCVTLYKKNSFLFPLYRYYKSYNTLFQQFILANSLKIEDTCDRKCFLFITSLLKDCRIKYLSLHAQNITLKEIKMVNGKNNLISIKLYNVNVFVDEKENEIAPMEDIITCLSTLKYINIK